MVSLRHKFISQDFKPEGCFIIPAACDLPRAIEKTRRALLRPEISSVVIQRHYPDLSAIANDVFSQPDFSPIDPSQATEHFAAFNNEAARDVLTVVNGFSADQTILEIEINITERRSISSHIDTFQQPDARANLDQGFLSGGILIIQALSLSGTGIFCHHALGERLKYNPLPIQPGEEEWLYEKACAEKDNIDPYYSAPGDIVILRQGNWGPMHPPCVHTWPICNIDDTDRPAYIADGLARPVLG